MRRFLCRASLLVMATIVAACSSGGGSSGSWLSSSGGYYKDDGPPAQVPADIDNIPDAVPRIEPLARGPNRPYTVMGKRYVPDTTERPYRKRGIASWYGRKFHGRKTSNGETYDMFAMTAAHTTLPIPSYVRVTRVSNGQSVIVRVNDRGPFLHNRVIDLSYAAAHRLGMVGPGSAEVVVERITPEQIRAGTWATESFASTAPTAMPPEPAAANPSPVVATADLANEPVFLQIGAFSSESNARALAARAAANMPGNLPVEVDSTAGQLYRVRIGPFANRVQALSSMDAVVQSLGVRPSISLP
ncbi:septal ring lytic transglycosylase RlpA family protein [Orrella daihaiensis]|uniref:Endolytic peptidoglycan transglycosylase RlpA n=1 Tax=Orrella daihaiensis TaxID=2782176 RepID=A0ABY4AK72_9BURK|nr:septal ring lytic transglycosylase RlpA family protein [Orrella daihaiensis]UOD50655.1 septal ring lytic transglycosylase RlpA family protein [Orrella daihaiensis]